MPTQENPLDACEPALPAELRGPRPHPLPPWARRAPTGAILILAMAAVFSASLLWLGVSPLFQLAPAAVVAAGAGMLWWRARTRQLLRTGTPLVATIERLTMGDDDWLVEYSLNAGRGRERGRARWRIEILPDLSLWPQAGDPVYLLVDPARPRRQVVWGFGRPLGRAQGPVPWIYRALSRAAVALVIAATLLLVGALTWLGMRG